MRYRLRATVVDAFHYNGEHLNDLPEWAQNYRGYTHLTGTTQIAWTLDGTLMIPYHNQLVQCRAKDWITFDGTFIEVIKANDFDRLYEVAPAENAEADLVGQH